MYNSQKIGIGLLLIHACLCQHPEGYANVLQHAGKLAEHVQQHMKGDNPRTLSYFLQSNMDEIVALAGELFEEALEAMDTNISSRCLQDTELMLQALVRRERWALRMIDAMGKPASGLLDFNLMWLGNFDECVAVEAKKYRDPVNKTGQSHPYTGKYCMASFPIGGPSATSFTGPLQLSIGTCFPESCSAADTAALINALVAELPLNTTLPAADVTCQEKSLNYTKAAIAAVVVGSIFAVVISLATAYDVIIQHVLSRKMASSCTTVTDNIDKDSLTPQLANEKSPNGPANNAEQIQNGATLHAILEETTFSNVQEKSLHSSYTPGTLGKLLLSFSVYSNAPKILNTQQPSGTLTSVNGIRFLSMTWVILGHTYVTSLPVVDNVATNLPQMLKRFTFQPIANGTVSVDTFFVLSGLLVSYLSLREMKKRGGPLKFNWLLYYFHRYWRLTPPYMLLYVLYVPTFKYWSDGPLWPQSELGDFFKDDCKNSWWKNLLYINNLTDKKDMCMGWSWYLANDMQFYMISPIMLVPLYYSPILGGASCLALILVNFISAGIISANKSLNANLMFSSDSDAVFDIYFKPWCRVGPYVVGFFTGYLLHRTNCQVKMSKMLNMFGWTLATALAMSVIYGLYTPDGSIDRLSVGVSALYNATSRTVWGACVAWVIFACATGHGGPVNALLSWPGIIPLSRLTYCTYLVHPIVISLHVFSRRTTIHFYDLELIYLFLGHLCVSYATAFVLSLAFESPMMGLEKVLLGRKKNS